MLVIGFVTVAIDQPAHDFLDSGRPGEGKGAPVARGDCDFLVFGADAPLFARLGAARKIANQVVFIL